VRPSAPPTRTASCTTLPHAFHDALRGHGPEERNTREEHDMTDSTSARWTRRMMATVLAVLTAVSMSIGAAQVEPSPPQQPTQPTQPVDPAPAQPTDPVQPVQPTDPVAPVPPVEGEEDEDAVQPDVPTAPGLPATGDLGFGTLPEGVDPNEPVIQLGADQSVTQQQFAMEFDRAMRSLAMQQGLPYTEQTREVFDRFRGEFLDMYATQRALLLEARERGIEIADEDVDLEIENLRDQVGADQFDRTLMDLGYLGLEDFRTSVRESLMAQRVADDYRADIAFTDEDLQEFYETNRTRFFQDRTFDEARNDVERRFVGERLGEQFRTLRADHGIETFADRIAWNWNLN
jgi:hypothetical protein